MLRCHWYCSCICYGVPQKVIICSSKIFKTLRDRRYLVLLIPLLVPLVLLMHLLWFYPEVIILSKISKICINFLLLLVASSIANATGIVLACAMAP